MPSAGFEPTIPASERPQTYDLDRAATGTGCFDNTPIFRNTARLLKKAPWCIYCPAWRQATGQRIQRITFTIAVDPRDSYSTPKQGTMIKSLHYSTASDVWSEIWGAHSGRCENVVGEYEALYFVWQTTFPEGRTDFYIPSDVSLRGDNSIPKTDRWHFIYQSTQCWILEDSNICCRTYWKPISCLTPHITYSSAAIGPLILTITITATVSSSFMMCWIYTVDGFVLISN